MLYLFYALFILACVALIISVLLQPGKADAGALFTSSISSTAFGPRGTQSLLAKITVGAAALFFLLALMLSSSVFTGSRSVIDTTPIATTPTATMPSATPNVNPSVAPSVAPVTESNSVNANTDTTVTPSASPSAANQNP